jgi:hypothetical protein
MKLPFRPPVFWIVLICSCVLLPVILGRMGGLIDLTIVGGIASWALIEHDKKR